MFEWLRCKDPLERDLLEDIANQIIEKRMKIDKNLAIEIANQVGKLFSK